MDKSNRVLSPLTPEMLKKKYEDKKEKVDENGIVKGKQLKTKAPHNERKKKRQGIQLPDLFGGLLPTMVPGVRGVEFSSLPVDPEVLAEREKQKHRDQMARRRLVEDARSAWWNSRQNVHLECRRLDDTLSVMGPEVYHRAEENMNLLPGEVSSLIMDGEKLEG